MYVCVCVFGGRFSFLGGCIFDSESNNLIKLGDPTQSFAFMIASVSQASHRIFLLPHFVHFQTLRIPTKKGT